MADRTDDTLRVDNTFLISIRECLEVGGHCWVEKMPHQFLPSLPPQIGPPERTCKHCGLKQRGVYQEPVRWENVPA